MEKVDLEKLSVEYAEKFEGAMDGSMDQKSLIEHMVRVIRHEMPEVKGSEIVEIIETCFSKNTGCLNEYSLLLDVLLEVNPEKCM